MNKTVIPVFDHSGTPNVGRMPEWIRQPLSVGSQYGQTATTVARQQLNTVCVEARCPNRQECWSRGTATFMLLGETCTRACGFCAVKTGKPDWFDADEPRRVAEAALNMGLDYVVLTCVNRDDLPDGGASIFADTITRLRQGKPDMGIELLTSDYYRCQEQAIETIYQALCDAPGETRMVWGHNVETVPALYKTVRKGSDYQRTLKLLGMAAQLDGVEAKSAIMLGLDEHYQDVLQVFRDLREAGVERLAVGQYLRPSKYHLPVKRYLSPAEFNEYAVQARAMGFGWVKSGPLVRSSYHAEEEQSVLHI
ncbi:MAG: lipoyl synthase [Gammaproteobacteria bacterium]|nr:lipoyl synthase [Gammaproteobacteria bacterium]MDH5652492.1 lipoyl synthase [Gammaproteobacteria bacterium]